MQLAAEQGLPPKSCTDPAGTCCCPAAGPCSILPRSPSPSRGHHNPASQRGAQLTHLQLRSRRAVCGRRPLPATLNTCCGERRLPQGAFHSGKSHPPHGGSCFRGIPTRTKPHSGKLRQGGPVASVQGSARLTMLGARGPEWGTPSIWGGGGGGGGHGNHLWGKSPRLPRHGSWRGPHAGRAISLGRSGIKASICAPTPPTPPCPPSSSSQAA